MMTAQDYENQLRRMAKIVADWKAAGNSAVIQFNYPRSVCFIAAISDALEDHFVTADEGGIKLIKLLVSAEPIEPTVLMVRAVLENV